MILKADAVPTVVDLFLPKTVSLKCGQKRSAAASNVPQPQAIPHSMPEDEDQPMPQSPLKECK